MAKLKTPSKIQFCHFRAPNRVIELAEYDKKIPRILEHAAHCVWLHNNHLLSRDISLNDEFYFLNTTVGGETRIITKAGQRDYPYNAPQIVAKLEAYLAGKNGNQAGNAHSRGNSKYFDPAIPEHEKLEKQTFCKYKVEDENTAGKVILELGLIYGKWLIATHFIRDNKLWIRVVSWYLTTEQIKEAIQKIIEAR